MAMIRKITMKGLANINVSIYYPLNEKVAVRARTATNLNANLMP